MGLTKVRVEIDAETPDQVFDAVTDPEVRWNGWATPTFDRANAERVITMVTRDDQEDYHRFFWTSDREGNACLIMGESDGSDEWWWDFCGDDETGYPIGSWSWTWSLLEDEAPTGRDELAAYLTRRKKLTTLSCAVHNATMRAAREKGFDTNVAYAMARSVTNEVLEKVTV